MRGEEGRSDSQGEEEEEEDGKRQTKLAVE